MGETGKYIDEDDLEDEFHFFVHALNTYSIITITTVSFENIEYA